MKGSDKILTRLNLAIKKEMTAYACYLSQAAACANWGYIQLAEHFQKEAVEESGHARLLLDRLLFLEGVPEMTCEGVEYEIDVEGQLKYDLELEKDGVNGYRDGVAECLEEGDPVTRVLFEKILVDEEEHVNWLETQLHLLATLGEENYLQAKL